MDDLQMYEVARSLDVELTQSGVSRLAHPDDLPHDVGHELSEHANDLHTLRTPYGGWLCPSVCTDVRTCIRELLLISYEVSTYGPPCCWE